MSLMHQEAKEIPSVIERQLRHYARIMPAIVQRIQQANPTFIMTVGRGSSDHATTYAKYLFETQLGLVTASSAPSVATLYHSELHLSSALVMAFSQSGQSRDICEVLKQARAAGALTVACVNHEDSPLAQLADVVIPLYAGVELAVAATKSYVATLVMIAAFVAYWKADHYLLQALDTLPQRCLQAQQMDWSLLGQALSLQHHAMVLGRGYTFPIALEAALKLKETCKLHAEAFSSAEVLHGPFALMRDQFHLLVFMPSDQAAQGLDALLDRLKGIGAQTYLAIPKDKITENRASVLLPLPDSLHPLCDPIVAIQAFYLMAEYCAQLKHLNPNQPDHLAKVTDTL